MECREKKNNVRIENGLLFLCIFFFFTRYSILFNSYKLLIFMSIQLSADSSQTLITNTFENEIFF